MTKRQKEERAFWLKARKKILRDYGKHKVCDFYDDNCVVCKATKAISFIDNHLKLL
jgi:hypothetical protein